MKKEKIILLLKKLTELGVSDETFKKVFSQDKRILTILADIEEEKLSKLIQLLEIYSETDYAFYEIINILCNSKFFNESYYVLVNENAIEANISIMGAKIVSEAPNEFNARYASSVLTNEIAINAGIALESARIINESPSVFNASYVKDVLTNAENINKGIALEKAKKINNIEGRLCAVLLSEILNIEASSYIQKNCEKISIDKLKKEGIVDVDIHALIKKIMLK